MMNPRLIVAFLLLAGSLLLAGCPGPAVQPDVDDGPPIESAPELDAGQRGRIDGPESYVEEGPDADLLGNLIVYFEFDLSDIRSEFNAMLAAHGRYLAENPSADVRLEGHADERGSREYNIGLGERRSQAVRRLLLLQGASGTQISTVSYGEERPAILGSDEEAWKLNRRVELVYQQ
jgi:peptidoglycan-associated lipoprotein